MITHHVNVLLIVYSIVASARRLLGLSSVLAAMITTGNSNQSVDFRCILNQNWGECAKIKANYIGRFEKLHFKIVNIFIWKITAIIQLRKCITINI